LILSRPHYRIATAPCSWGVDFSDRPENPPWQRVLDEAALAGFEAIDLGPVGYFPTDATRLADELRRRDLKISAGGLFDPLSVQSSFTAIVEKTRRTCELLRALEAPRLVIVDCVSKERGRTAGRSSAATRLDDGAWAAMMDRVIEVARIARDDYGVSSFLHPHAGCYLEFEDEIDRAMSDLPARLVGLCVDTGHSAYAGVDPVALIHRYGARIGHVHFKNIDAQVHATCVAEGVDFFGAITRGVFSLLSEGAVDFVAVSEALAAVDYSGLVVVEQDVDPKGKASPLDNARANRGFLKSVGMIVS
jgi:inosose dehydratase